MWNRITEFLKNNIIYLVVIVTIYVATASLVFAARHPWATDMERLIHMNDALLFKKVSYKEVRESYE
jgi:hypothetical protein